MRSGAVSGGRYRRGSGGASRPGARRLEQVGLVRVEEDLAPVGSTRLRPFKRPLSRVLPRVEGDQSPGSSLPSRARAGTGSHRNHGWRKLISMYRCTVSPISRARGLRRLGGSNATSTQAPELRLPNRRPLLVSKNMFSFTLKAWRGIILP